MTVMFTPIRVVCNNTLTMALNADGNRFRVLHLQMFDEEIQKSAEEALGISSQQMKLFQEQSEFLASKRAKDSQIANYIAELFQSNLLIERAKHRELDVNNSVPLPPLWDEFKHTAQQVYDAVDLSPGSNLKSAKGTWWGALNAVTYVVDHQKKSKAEGNALHSAWFGTGAMTKRKALDKAVEYAKVA